MNSHFDRHPSPDSPSDAAPRITWGHLLFAAIFTAGWLAHTLVIGDRPESLSTVGYLLFAAVSGLVWDVLIGPHFEHNELARQKNEQPRQPR